MTAKAAKTETTETTEHATVWEALCAAQREFTKIEKTGFNPHFKSKYATMTDIMGATKPAMLKHGLLMYQSPMYDTAAEKTMLVSRIVHAKSGEAIEDVMLLRVDANDQKFGAEVAYKKRYMMSAQLWVIDGLDDDGESSRESSQSDSKQKPAQTQKTQQRASQPAQKPVKQKPVKQIDNSTDATAWAKGLKPDDIQTIKSWLTPSDAFTWAVNIGACANEDDAKTSMREIVAAQFDGKLTTSTMSPVMQAFFLRQIKTLNDAANVSFEDAEEVPF